MNVYCERLIKEQIDDIKTDKVRDDLEVSLTDKEYIKLKLMAYKAGFRSAGEFLSSFVGDLTGWQSNGRDEQDKAAEWYERAFGISEHNSNFRYHLFNYDYTLAEIDEMLRDEDIFNEVYREYLSENEGLTNESKEECMATLEEIIEKEKEL